MVNTSNLTLDSSIIVAALREQEENHLPCRELLHLVAQGKYRALEPYTVLIEVVAAIARRTSNKQLAGQIGEQLQKIEFIHFFDLIKTRAQKVLTIAQQTALRGMDAIVVQIAVEYGTTLVTLDKEMAQKAQSVVPTQQIHQLISAQN